MLRWKHFGRLYVWHFKLHCSWKLNVDIMLSTIESGSCCRHGTVYPSRASSALCCVYFTIRSG